LPSAKQIENKTQRRCLDGELRHSTLRRMNSLQQIIEGERFTDRHYELAIDQEPLFRKFSGGRFHFRKVARQILTGFGLHDDVVAVPAQQTAEAIPFRLVLPMLAGGNGPTERASMVSGRSSVFRIYVKSQMCQAFKQAQQIRVSVRSSTTLVKKDGAD
jgi:hypothetical protein